MKIASNVTTPPLLPVTPRAAFRYPICPKFVPPFVLDGDFKGFANFGEGTAYPLPRRWLINAAHYQRPGRLLLRKESFYSARKRSTGALSRFDFGPKAGARRTNATSQADYQLQLCCPFPAVVSQTIQYPPPPTEPVDYRITLGYGFQPEVAVSNLAQGLDYPMWSEAIGAQTYLNQFGAVAAYFIEDVLTRGLTSVLPREHIEDNPLDRYEKCGSVIYDMADQLVTQDLVPMEGGFPLYRDKWFEDGHDSSSPAAWYSVDALISIAWVAWDKRDDGIVPVTEEMMGETEGLIVA